MTPKSARREAIEAALAAALKAALAERYRIDRELGRGGMATVYVAEDLRTQRLVAVKVLARELGASLSAERFLREIDIAAQLAHPNIVPLIDSGEVGGDASGSSGAKQLYYVMPYVEGETLRARLTREHQLPVDDAVAIARDVAAALDHAHQHDVVHRDVKPENILLSEGRALVADFGIARAVRGREGARGPLTSAGVALGTPAYMAPEQVAADTQIDARTDVYALGCVLYEMLAGQPPFVGASPQAVLAKRMAAPAPRVDSLRPDVPPHVTAALARALERDPADRFPTAAAFGAALDARDAGLGTGNWGQTRVGSWGQTRIENPNSSLTPIPRRESRRPIVLGALAVALLVALLALWRWLG